MIKNAGAPPILLDITIERTENGSAKRNMIIPPQLPSKCKLQISRHIKR